MTSKFPADQPFTKAEDEFLERFMSKNIHEGKTLGFIFEKAAIKLRRTDDQVQKRWTDLCQKKTGLTLVADQPDQIMKQPDKRDAQTPDIAFFFSTMYQIEAYIASIQQENADLKKQLTSSKSSETEIARLNKRIKEVNDDYEALFKQYRELEGKHNGVLQLIQQLKSLDLPAPSSPATFTMERNGHLRRAE